MSVQTASRISAIDANAIQDTSAIDGATKAMMDRRIALLGPGYRLQYSRPVHPVRAKGTKIWDASGEELLDAYNNVPCVGHANDRVTRAMTDQLGMINTNTRYLQDELIGYAEALLSTHDPRLNRAMFVCTGSEANDLALRIARQVTGQQGIIASEFAYHGNTDLVSSISPAAGAGIILDKDLRLVPAPDRFRQPGVDLGAQLARQVQEQIDSLASRGVGLAAFIVDGIFSTDGIHPADHGVLQPAIDVVHRAGGLFILDEVQSGFARTGTDMWGYQRFGVLPDLVTTGKPTANGLPVAGIVAQWDLFEDFGRRVPYFNTFGGGNACIAAAHEVLRIIEEDRLLDNVEKQSRRLREGMTRILQKANHTTDVRGAGLYLGVEFCERDAGMTPDPVITASVVDAMRENGVLISAAGTYGNVLKIRPPLVFSDADTDRFLETFEKSIRSTGA